MASEPKFVMVCDFVCPDDPQGRTYRQINEATPHAIPIGSLVELHSDSDYGWEGARLFVVGYHRDCDGTPLYALAINRNERFPAEPWWTAKYDAGYSDHSLTVIASPQPERTDE